MTEQQIQQEILIALGARSDLGRVWRVNAGTTKSLQGERIIKGAPAGHPDLCGILAGGRWLGIEVKSERGRQSEQQARFAVMAQRFGGAYILARSVDEAIAGAEAALE